MEYKLRPDIDKYLVDFADIPYQRISKERVLSGYPALDYLTKGIEVGLTEIVGSTNVGKSILTSMLISNAIKQHYKVGVFASEHSLRDYKMLVMQQNAKKGEFQLVPFVDNNGNDTNIADWYVTPQKEQEISKLYDHNLYLYNTQKVDRDVNTLCEFMIACCTKKGIRFFILDNFMEIENNNNNQFQEQTSIITKIRNTALRFNLFVVLVMHTNKQSVENGFRLTIQSAFGTSNATNKGYNVLALYRKDCMNICDSQKKQLERFKADLAKNGFDFDKCDSFIEVLKTKGNGNGIIGLNYIAESKTFVQAEKIAKTEADKIYKRYEKQVEMAELIEDNQILPITDENDNLLF